MVLICLTGLSVGLPIAWISLAKFLVFLTALAYLLLRQTSRIEHSTPLRGWTGPAILTIVSAFALSLLWTDSSQDVALLAFAKHGRVLEILLLVVLIRTERDARAGITAFAAGQTFLLVSSWLLAAGLAVPWATSHMGTDLGRYVVFSTYLDQSIIFATSAAVMWHLRAEQFWPRWLSVLFALAALTNTTLLLGGRTGLVVALTVIALAVMWWMPRRLQLAAFLATPVLALAILYAGSNHVRERLSEIVQGSQGYATQSLANIRESSSGWRLLGTGLAPRPSRRSPRQAVAGPGRHGLCWWPTER